MTVGNRSPKTELKDSPPDEWLKPFEGSYVTKQSESSPRRVSDKRKLPQSDLAPMANEALRYAHDIRKFEIDLYWKRSAYFQTVLGIILGALALTLKTNETAGVKSGWTIEVSVLQATILCLGSVLAFAWYAATRGGKYWQRNWESHVDVLEDKVTGPLYKTVYAHAEQGSSEFFKLLKEYPYSTSKINSFVALVFLTLFVSAQVLFLFSATREFTFYNLFRNPFF
jgi:hypothetical protein